ncbi:ABC transporter ATP-binding protein [Acrocarpospora catenulata]|uniref:ABC transporter ATP-binding protein n=1 Tax=Acrocarpospora catenulata TaxID=2836182 RepID=UPI001BDA998D|nr:ABC transporter ATP-binding protein [Acrocarpospora catenulata]
MAAVRLDRVTVRFPGTAQPAVTNVSLSCAPGEFVVLVGRSGSGKTTILNMLAGLLPPDEGEVRVLDRPPVAARADLGYMFARDALMPWRTARRNVELGLEILGRSKQERHEVSERMLRKVGLEHAAGRLPWQLSQGMRQRVALARTWAREPKLLLMDEPFSALDAQTRQEAQSGFLETWAGTGATVVLVTHDLREALLLGDRVVLLAGGRVIREVRVPFARPRDLEELAVDPRVHALEHELRDLLR